HWAFISAMTLMAAESVLHALTVGADSPAEMMHWQRWRLQVMSLLPGIWVLFSLSYSRGNHVEFLSRWRAALIAAFAAPVGLAFLFRNSLIVSQAQAASAGRLFTLGWAGAALNLMLLLAAVIALMNLERTYIAATGTMRWRIKFMVLGMGVIFVVRTYTSSQTLLFHNSVNLSLEGAGNIALLLGGMLMLRALFRPGCFDTDIYPPQTAFHHSLTLILTGFYLLMVGVFAKVVAFLGGDAAFTLKAFVLLIVLILTTLTLLSDRARLYARRFFSRHFQRPTYDYRAVWRRFTEETAASVTQKELCEAAVKLVSDIFQVLSATVWLVDERNGNLNFAASTSLSESKAAELSPSSKESSEVIGALKGHAEPVDLDTSTEPWAATLKKCHPDEFRKGGNRIAAPMLGGGRLFGVMVVGDRVNGTAFSWEDFELIKCIADGMAAWVLNIQLSEKLLQTRELEAFQTMSAFFVHDLKNTASTLNLMLKNLPTHFDNPAFREDALRAIGKSAEHMNQLIGRLGQLRHELEIHVVECDLNEIVSKALADWQGATGARLVVHSGALPKLLLDPEQMLKVVTNLALNAREAVSADGEVRIETRQNEGWVILSVSDNGTGMDPEFVKRSLFRPFQTTKKNGLGIGLFQSKMIVEAHQGKMQVETESGKGTIFRILLPFQTRINESQTANRG
ncbi:MAG: PEP-CTERM system histidine kinase PrsK, partial [Verrucomicrobia bacterium]|nr:PEP-CTERM system histidine kinase PrsK [Verrucomicrobiota bacterium]